MAFGLFRRKERQEPAAATIESPAEQAATDKEQTNAISATGIDVEESLQQLQKFKKIHKWV